MRLYRAMSFQELIRTKKDSFVYRQQWKWFTPSFRFLYKRVLNNSFNSKEEYNHIIAINTTELHKFKKINNKEYMLHCSTKINFSIDWIKCKEEIMQEINQVKKLIQ